MPRNLYRRGSVWYARIQSGGRPYRQSLQTSSRAEADKRLQKIRSKLSHAAFHGEARHSWKEAIVRWTDEFLPGIAEGTAERYRVSIRQFEHQLTDLYIDEIDRKTVAKIASRKGATNATRRRDLTALSSVLRSCVGWGWIDTNPAREYDRSILPERRAPIHIPADRDVALLVGKVSGGLGRLVRWLADTGCREEEGAGLEHPQLSMDRQEATLLKTKRNRIRTLRLTNPACPQGLDTGISTPRHIKSPYVFWHGDGERYHNVASQLRAAIKALSEEKDPTKRIKRFRVHDLRHRFAVRWLKAGGDIYALQRHMGHTSVKTTEVYLQFIAQQDQSESSQKSAQLQRFGGGSDDAAGA